MEVIVPDDQLSLAIGKKGQNVRLASRLTGWNLEVRSESEAEEEARRARLSLERDSGRRRRHCRAALPARVQVRRGGRSGRRSGAGGGRRHPAERIARHSRRRARMCEERAPARRRPQRRPRPTAAAARAAEPQRESPAKRRAAESEGEPRGARSEVVTAKHIPIRSCHGLRRSACRRADAGAGRARCGCGLRPDPARCAGGRGGYLHREQGLLGAVRATQRDGSLVAGDRGPSGARGAGRALPLRAGE